MAGFGSAYLKTGSFTKGGRKKIFDAGFNSMDEFKKSLGDGPQTKQTLADALAKGPQRQAAKPPAEATDATKQESAVMPSPAEGLTAQGADIATRGRSVMDKPSAAETNLLAGGQDAYSQGRLNLSDMLAQAGLAQDPRIGQASQDRLNKQESQARQELDQYFMTGDPAAKARSQIAQNEVDAAASGMTGSARMDNQRQAAVERGLIRDRANAQLALGQNLRSNVLNQLDQSRNANLGLASLFGQIGTSGMGTGLNAIGQAGQQGQSRLGLGATLAGQGFDQQAKAIGLGSDLSQREWENQMNWFNTMNQIRQQNLANIQGNKQNEYTRQQIEEMQRQKPPGLLSSIF